MNRRVAALLATVLCPCCGGSIWLPSPEAGGGVLVAAYESTAGRQLIAADLSGPIEIEDVRPGSEVDVLVYRRAFEELPFSEGQLESAANGCRLLDLAAPDVIGRIRAIEGSSWAALSEDEVDSSLDAFLVDTEDDCRAHCVELEAIESRSLIGSVDPAWAIVLPSKNVLIGTLDNKIFATSETHEVRMVTRDANIALLTSAWVDEAGSSWFGNNSGQVFRGDLVADVLELALVADAPAQARALSWIATASVGGELEIIGLDDLGGLHRHTAERSWELIHSFAPRVPQASPKGGVARVRAGEWLIGWGFDTELVRLVEGRTTLESPGSLDEGITAVAEIAGLGSVIGTARTGRAFARDASGWRSLGSDGLGIDAAALLPFDDGFLLGGAAGAVRQYSQREGFCAPSNVAALGIQRILRLSDNELVFVSEAALSGAIVTFVRDPSPP